jgi:hypothetical protein
MSKPFNKVFGERKTVAIREINKTNNPPKSIKVIAGRRAKIPGQTRKPRQFTIRNPVATRKRVNYCVALGRTDWRIYIYIYIPPVSRSTKTRSMIPKRYLKAKTLNDLGRSFSGVYKWIYSPNEVVN